MSDNQNNDSFFSEANLNRLGDRFGLMSQVSRQFGAFANEAMESAAQIGVVLPVLEILVTVGAFIAAGLANTLGYEVLAGLVFSQVAALYLVSHYRHMAMHLVGQVAIYLSVATGAANTAAAVYLALTAHGETAVPPFAILLPAYSSGAAVLFYYTSKLFTAAQVAERRRLALESDNRLMELARAARAQRQMAATRDAMQQQRLNLEKAAMVRLANDETMKTIQTKAAYLTLVNDILTQYQINPNSKLGKQLVELADNAVNGKSGTEADGGDDYERQYQKAIDMMLNALQQGFGVRFKMTSFEDVKDGRMFALAPSDIRKKDGRFGVKETGERQPLDAGHSVFIPANGDDFLPANWAANGQQNEAR